MTTPENEPLARFHRWFREAQRAGIELPEAMALATADAAGRPAVRTVLLKEADARGFVFFTGGRSRKGRELVANPTAALAFDWHETGKQVCVKRRVEGVDAAEADAYRQTRPLGSRLAGRLDAERAAREPRAAPRGVAAAEAPARRRPDPAPAEVDGLPDRALRDRALAAQRVPPPPPYPLRAPPRRVDTDAAATLRRATGGPRCRDSSSGC